MPKHTPRGARRNIICKSCARALGKEVGRHRSTHNGGDYGPEVKETGLGLQSLRDAESGGPSMLLKQNPGAELVRQGDWP